MKLVNWNVGCANPRSKSSRVVARADEIRDRIDRYSPEIVCLTETHSELLQGGHRICARPDCGSGIQEGPRKVLLWSRERWRQVVDDIGDDRLPPGRFISGVTRTSIGDVTVVGLCIPWKGSRTPVYGGVRGEWDDHEGLPGTSQRSSLVRTLGATCGDGRFQPEVQQVRSNAITPCKLAPAGDSAAHEGGHILWSQYDRSHCDKR